MLGHFFTLAAASPTRRSALRRVLLAHVAALGLVLVFLDASEAGVGRLAVGNLLIIAGIVEGALLIGWRLTQLPKSQALEFILVTPLESHRFLFGEALVCMSRLALVTAAGLPLLLL